MIFEIHVVVPLLARGVVLRTIWADRSCITNSTVLRKNIQMTQSLFFALQPDQAALTQISYVQKELELQDVRLENRIPVERLHVTLCFIDNFPGEIPQLVLDGASAAAKSITSRPVKLGFDKALSFRSARPGRPLVLASSAPMTTLQLFRRELAAKLCEYGMKTDTAAFTPHITLAYEPGELVEQPVATPVEWTAREFVLIKSFVGKGRYEILGRWSLH